MCTNFFLILRIVNHMQNTQYSRCKIIYPRLVLSICIWHFKAALIRVSCFNKSDGQFYWDEWCGPRASRFSFYYKVKFIHLYIFALGKHFNNLNSQDRFIFLGSSWWTIENNMATKYFQEFMLLFFKSWWMYWKLRWIMMTLSVSSKY